MINLITVYMLSGTVLSALIAAAKDRSVIAWATFGIVAGPLAVAIVMWLPSRRPASASPPSYPPHAMRSIADEVDALDDMNRRGMITDEEFKLGKAQIFAWPVTSPIPPALSPMRVITDGRRTWTSYHLATRAAFEDLARRHRLNMQWRDDVLFELTATYPAQPGLSFEFTLGLSKGMLHCWGDGWSLGDIEVGRPDLGLPRGIDHALDALINGSGRILTRTAYGTAVPFQVSLQVREHGSWVTIHRRLSLPWPPLWCRRQITNAKVASDQG